MTADNFDLIVEGMRDSLGISCVEIYLLAVLKTRGVDYTCLFEESFADIGATINDFLKNDCTYAAYSKLPRLQKTAKDKKLIDFSSHLVDLKYASFDYYLYEVTPGYKDSQFQPWRDDHYLLFWQGNYYDCYPPSSIKNLDINKLNGNRIGIKINENALLPEHEESLRILSERIRNTPTETAEAVITSDNIIKMRDALLICKISRRRINEILRIDAISEQIGLLTKLCNLFEVFRLRGRIGEYKEILKKIFELEKSWNSTKLK